VVIELQLERAGVRLAWLLNEALKWDGIAAVACGGDWTLSSGLGFRARNSPLARTLDCPIGVTPISLRSRHELSQPFL
jgi:hypothetical protein